MAGCVSCFILPLLLFLFHRFLQPLLLKFWNPWDKKEEVNDPQQEVLVNGSVPKSNGHVTMEDLHEDQHVKLKHN